MSCLKKIIGIKLTLNHFILVYKYSMKTKYNYIIYHQNCIDGFTGFYLFMKTDRWEKKPIVYPDIPSTNKVPPDVEGRNVIIIDVAYKPTIIKEIASKAKKVLFIDHHISIIEDVKNLKLDDPHEIFYDDKHSGASLVWKYFYEDMSSMPRFVKYVEDNDIGAWIYNETLPFIAGLEVEYVTEPTHENLKKWDSLLKEKYLDDLIKRGQNYNTYKTFLIDRYKKKYDIMYFPSKKLVKKGLFDKVGSYKVAVVNSNCPSVSLLGKQIANEIDCDFVFLWIYNVRKRRYIISLRSKKTDVSEIAKIMGGGGHTLASAFSFVARDYTIDDMFTPLR